MYSLFLHLPKLNLCSSSPVWCNSLCAMRKVIPFRAQSVFWEGGGALKAWKPLADHLSRARVQNSHHAATVQGGASQRLDYFSNCGNMEWSRGKRWLWWITWFGHLRVYLRMGGSQNLRFSQNRIQSFSWEGHVILSNYRLMLCTLNSRTTSVSFSWTETQLEMQIQKGGFYLLKHL